MYESGADVVYHAAGKSGIGVFDAVEAAARASGPSVSTPTSTSPPRGPEAPHPDLDAQARRHRGVRHVKSFDGRAPLKPGYVNYDLKSDGVGYSTSGGFLDDIRTRSTADADKIKSGEIKVPADPKQVK